MCCGKRGYVLSNSTENDRRPKESIHRRDGITLAERYLKRLCDHSFLSLWSHAGVYRDQWLSGTVKEGKEVCDLLVVFENHIIIFSDKDCVYPTGDDQEVNWRRWFKRAVQKSADQIWGAERWIKAYPERLFLDSACTQHFPLPLPDPTTATFHRILVAHGVSERCREVLGGSGSLMIAPQVIGSMHTVGGADGGRPFTIGQIDPAKGYVHVFDDTSLQVVMRTLDTITDFVAYLIKKERFIQSSQLLWAAGEDDLLAYYLRDINSDGEHDFVVPDNADAVSIDEGFWQAFVNSSQRKAQIKANRVSYLWDMLIERFATHILADTQYYTTHSGVEHAERIMRFLARESRTRRRMLAQSLLQMLETTPSSMRRTRVVQPSGTGDPYYVFLLLPQRTGEPEDEYRIVRRQFLEACCMVAKLVYPEAQDIVGIATETGSIANEPRSEDALYLDAHYWTEELQAEAQQLQQDLGLLTNLTKFASVESEYPPVPSKPVPSMKGRDRNRPCPCGSRKKFKKCCGR